MSLFKKIMLERTGCLGPCPVYRVEISGDGAVTYTGEAFVRKEGEHNWKIFQGQIDQLNEALDRYDFFAIPEYETDIHVTDAPSCILRVVMADGRERITVNGAAEGRYPERLNDLQSEIDRIVGTEKMPESS